MPRDLRAVPLGFVGHSWRELRYLRCVKTGFSWALLALIPHQRQTTHTSLLDRSFPGFSSLVVTGTARGATESIKSLLNVISAMPVTIKDLKVSRQNLGQVSIRQLVVRFRWLIGRCRRATRK
jgi:hypothetical protein